MNDKLKIFNDWLEKAQPGNKLTVSNELIETWDQATVDEFNALLNGQRAMNNIITDKSAEGLVITALEGIRHSMFQGENGDGRTKAAPEGQEGNPFRTRYRQLSPVETEMHDDIKSAAFELHKLIAGIVEARAKANQYNGPDVMRDLALAKTALEDSVMRAVRALTA